MKTEKIRNLTIEDFKSNPELAEYIAYIDKDFLMIDNMEGIQSEHTEFRLDCFLIIMCLEDEMKIGVNDKSYTLQLHDTLLCLPNTILRIIEIKDKYKVKILGFSNNFIRNTLKIEKHTWAISMNIFMNPIKSIEIKNKNDYFAYYGALLESRIKDKSNCYQNEILKNIFSALFLDIIGCIGKEVTEEEKEKYSKENIKRADYTYIRFIEMLSEDCGKHRSVSYFADKLCYSTKYFSNIVKQTCGKNPLEIINEKAINHITYQLKYSDKSIKEISDEFNFPNQSFFGRYVKAHTGLSPINYRNTKEE